VTEGLFLSLEAENDSVLLWIRQISDHMQQFKFGSAQQRLLNETRVEGHDAVEHFRDVKVGQ
jgi:hypothetical protein